MSFSGRPSTLINQPIVNDGFWPDCPACLKVISSGSTSKPCNNESTLKATGPARPTRRSPIGRPNEKYTRWTTPSVIKAARSMSMITAVSRWVGLKPSRLWLSGGSASVASVDDLHLATARDLNLVVGQRHNAVIGGDMMEVIVGARASLARVSQRLLAPKTWLGSDVITGGFPCQDISLAGARDSKRDKRGLRGERSGLFWEVIRILKEVQPRWVVLENVVNLLAVNDCEDFETVIRALADGGYVGCWRVLNAQYFGVPQQRRRVFLVAGLGRMPPSEGSRW